MANPQPNHLPALQKFFRLVKSCNVNCEAIGKDKNRSTTSFISTKDIKERLAANDYEFVADLLDEIFGRDWSSNINVEELATKCPLVFAILLCLGQGRYITNFIRHADLQDRRLPFVHRPEEFPHFDNVDFFESFREVQWKWCAPEMTMFNDQEFRDEDILPFKSKTWIHGGMSAAVHKVEIHPDYDGLSRMVEIVRADFVIVTRRFTDMICRITKKHRCNH